METFDDMEKLGWSRVIDPKTQRKIYVRPNKTKVRQKRDLSDHEKEVLGNILFPCRQSHPQNQSQACPPAPLGTPASTPCPVSPLTQPESGGAASTSVSWPSSGAGISRGSVFSLPPQETNTDQPGEENELPEVKDNQCTYFDRTLNTNLDKIIKINYVCFSKYFYVQTIGT